MKAISPIVAIVILMLMTVAAGGMAYITITSYQSQASASTEGGIESIASSSKRQLKIESVADGKIYLRNLGTENFQGAAFYIDGRPLDVTSSARNAVFYGDKAIDRSPCGTGTSARMAQLHNKGRLSAGEDFIHESIIGSKFTGRIERETLVGSVNAIVPSIEGWARIMGYNTITINEEDPFAFGFQVI